MYGTIQLSEVIFGMRINSLSNSKNSLASVKHPNLQFWIFIRSNLKNYIN